MEDFRCTFDSIYKSGKIEDVKKYISNSLENAILSKNTSLVITILNEAIGFYRDISEFDNSIALANSLIKVISTASIDDKSLSICYINIANSFRASNKNLEAIDYFLKAETILIKLDTSNKEYKALLNNLALCYMNLSEYDKAINYLNNALKKSSSKDIEYGISNINLSLCYMNLNDLKNAFTSIGEAELIFKKHQDDFHYMMFLQAKARYLSLIKDYDNSINYYDKALAYTLKTIGYTKGYEELFLEAKEVYSLKGLDIHQKGLSLSKEYFNEYLLSIANSTLAFASIGFGSDKFGYDDEISEDHDFGPNIYIISKEQDALDNIKGYVDTLPKIFKRYYNINGFVKLFTINDIINEFHIIIDKPDDYSLSLISNGKIFYDKSNLISSLKNRLKEKYNYFHLERLIKEYLSFEQLSCYNIKRAMKRNDNQLVKYLIHEIPLKAVSIVYLLNRKYLIHDKWHLRGLKGFYLEEEVLNLISDLRIDNVTNKVDEFSIRLIKAFVSIGLIEKYKSNDLSDYKNELIEFAKDYYNKYDLVGKVIDLEWEMFTEAKNIGKRAMCQDNYEYFNLMRKSQAFALSYNTLESYYNDLYTAKLEGYNIVAYKYGYMEESTDPIEFNKIKNYLPIIDNNRKIIQEEIIKLQLEELIELYNDYPLLKNMMRSTYTSTDTINNTSYETYLRGELSSYSNNTVILYGKNIIDYENVNKSFVKKVIGLSHYFSGMFMK